MRRKKIVTLALAKSEPAQTVIDILKETLALAEAGEITCIGIARVSPGGFVGSAFATSGALYLLRRCEKYMGIAE